MPEDLTPQFPLSPASATVTVTPPPSAAGTTVVGGFMASPNGLSQGQMSLNGSTETILVGKATAPNVGVGVFIGNAGDNTYDFRAGDPAGAYIWWDADLGTLTVAGTITATAGAIGGFSIGADYVRDAANGMGLASTVTGGDDVRFWAGAAFASRATAPFYVTKSGVVVAATITATGTINAQGGYLGAPTTVLNISTSGLDVGTTGHLAGGQSGYNTGIGFFLGYSSAAYKFSIGNPAGDYLTWDGTHLATNKFVLTGIGAFGGNGSDGALVIASGTTTINLGGAAYVVKNYTSISITGTGQLTFSNPNANGTLIVLKSQGAVVLTSSTSPLIDASGMGAAGGASKSGSGNGTINGVAGNNGNPGTSYSLLFAQTNNGVACTSTGPALNPGAGAAAVTFALNTALFSSSNIFLRYKDVWMGAGGAGGGWQNNTAAWTATSGAGGAGGPCLIIECAGDLNFTGVISVAGIAGGNASATGTGTDAGGGGGGAGGYFQMLYITASVNSGTVTVAGGAAGAGGGSATHSTGGGGGGNALGGGSNPTNDTGGAAANGTSLIAQNTFFA